MQFNDVAVALKKLNCYKWKLWIERFHGFFVLQAMSAQFLQYKTLSTCFPQMLSVAVLIFEDLPLSFQWFEGTPFGNSSGCHKIRTEKDSEKAGAVGKNENQKG